MSFFSTRKVIEKWATIAMDFGLLAFGDVKQNFMPFMVLQIQAKVNISLAMGQF